MKLQSALQGYGLLPKSPQQWVQGDELPYEMMRTGDHPLRVSAVITRLNNDLLQGVQAVSAKPENDGLRFHGFNYEQWFAWESTKSVHERFGWTCGPIEASFRRFLIHAKAMDWLTPDERQHLIPILDRWRE